MTKANNFQTTMKRVWEMPGLEHNAVVRATRLGATQIRPFGHDGFRETPGDMPASLWRFRDGSEYVIGDDGSWCMAARRPGSPSYLDAEPRAQT